MTTMVALVIPEAPMPVVSRVGTRNSIRAAGFRLGILDNSKANAHHLLEFLARGIRAALPVTSLTVLRKPSAGEPAPAAILDQLATEADFVISAMAD